MHTLERLLCDWLGPRKAEYGETPDKVEHVQMPEVLQRFYCFAGRWPFPRPERAPVVFECRADSYFYAGIATAGLATLDSLQTSADGRLVVFHEHSGNWIGTTESTGIDPPVWVQSCLENEHFNKPVRSEELLSGWVVSHVLSSIAWEAANASLCGTAAGLSYSRRSDQPIGGLSRWFLSDFQHAQLLWTGRAGPPEVSGNYYLFRGSILVHESGSLLRLAALTPAGADEMRRRAAVEDMLE